ncbi:MAG: uracil-DNA glycosylase [Sphingomonadales bacterium]|jgi:DNA polymerase|nr:uracil-DNA glycosylase [Sphingomonadales bacterium]
MERGNEPFSAAAAASVLQWWTDAGVDMLIDEEPRDWLRPKPRAEPVAAAAAPAASEAPVAPAQDAEELPGQLDLFQAWLKDSDRLPFAAPEAPRICPSGDPASGLMILADMPSGEDCGAGTLISGEAGRLFDRMLAAIGRDRASVYLAALSCLRSPTGSFTTDAAKQCATLARHQIGLVAPRAVLLLGDATAKALLGLSVAQARGRWHEIATHHGAIKALATISPKQLLDAPRLKRLAWEDLQMLVEEVEK